MHWSSLSPPFEHRSRFVFGKNYRQFGGSFGSFYIFQPIERLLQDFTVKEQQGAEALILGGSGHFALYRQMGEKLSDLALSHFLRVPFFVEKDIISHPMEVSLFGADAVVLFCWDYSV
jgi:hypothetical protein